MGTAAPLRTRFLRTISALIANYYCINCEIMVRFDVSSQRGAVMLLQTGVSDRGQFA